MYALSTNRFKSPVTQLPPIMLYISHLHNFCRLSYTTFRSNPLTYYLTDEIAEFIYAKQKENGINMNDTGVNSADKPLLVSGAKGAEAIAVGGFWYIITPYISRPNGTQTSYDYNVMDSPAVYYCNKNIINGLMNYLRTYEGWTDDVPAYNSGFAWSCARVSGYSAWYVNLGSGSCSTFTATGRLSVWPVSAF